MFSAALNMGSFETGQPIAGTTKPNPLFTSYIRGEDEHQEELYLYYGLELLGVVSADRNNPSFKLLVVCLYNAGERLKVLQQVFHVDPKTIQRWGRAVRNCDAQQVARVLGGRHNCRKLSPEIRAYVRARWPHLSGHGIYGIRKRLRQEIQAVFGVKLSQETLRPLEEQLMREQALDGMSKVSSAATTGPYCLKGERKK
jgi:hypothetical protein